MTVSERDRHAIGPQGREPVDWIADKARFGLFSVGDHGRPGGLEALNRVANGALKQGSRRVLRDPASGELPHACDEFGGSGNTANRLRGNRHAGNPTGGTRALSNGRASIGWLPAPPLRSLLAHHFLQASGRDARSSVGTMNTTHNHDKPAIVLVHGAFA